MATFNRPAINSNDGYIQKLIKYIPAEIVAGYTALTGYLSVNTNTDIPPHYKTYYMIVLCILLVITPIWTYYAVLDNDQPAGPSQGTPPNKKQAWFHASIATISFTIWVYAIGNPLLKTILCDCTNTGCPDCGLYSPVLGSIILVLFTILTPLFERIVFGTRLPAD